MLILALSDDRKYLASSGKDRGVYVIMGKECRKGHSYSAVIGMAAVPHIATLDGALYQKFSSL